MTDFITQHASIVFYAFVSVIGVAVYFYKASDNKSNLIISNKLDNIEEKIDGLCKKDIERKSEIKILYERTSKLDSLFAAQTQRCDDRATSCLGREARQEVERLKEKLNG